MAVRGGVDALICTKGNPPQPVTVSNAGDYGGTGVPCIIQGAILYYCPLAAMLWWVLLVWVVFEAVVREQAAPGYLKRLHLYYHFIAWGLPLIGVVILFATENFGSLELSPSCFFTDPTQNGDYGWCLFYAPLCAGLIFGTILMSASIIKFVRIRFRFSGHLKGKIEQLLHMIMLVVMLYLELLYPIGFRIYTEVVSDQISTALDNQVECGAKGNPDCPLSDSLNYGAALLNMLNISCYGLVLFISVFSSDMYVWWRDLIYSWFTMPWKKAITITQDMIFGSGKSASLSATASGTDSIDEKSMEVISEL